MNEWNKINMLLIIWIIVKIYDFIDDLMSESEFDGSENFKCEKINFLLKLF